MLDYISINNVSIYLFDFMSFFFNFSLEYFIYFIILYFNVYNFIKEIKIINKLIFFFFIVLLLTIIVWNISMEIFGFIILLTELSLIFFFFIVLTQLSLKLITEINIKWNIILNGRRIGLSLFMHTILYWCQYHVWFKCFYSIKYQHHLYFGILLYSTDRHFDIAIRSML